MNLLTHFRKITILRFVLAGLVLLFSVPALFADGIASRYPNDVGIENDPDVILADGFESYTSPSQLLGKWNEAAGALRIATEPGNYVGGHKSLEMELPIGTGAYGNGITKKISPNEPVLFVRAYTKFDPGFSLSGSTHNGILLSGRYPGPGNPPPRDGSGFFLFTVQNFKDSNTRTGTMQPGYTFVYSYWPFQLSNYGDWWYPDGWVIYSWGLWVTQPGNYPNWMPIPNWQPIRGVWYCYEFMVKVNTLGRRDGEVAYWINGQLAGRFPDLFIRSVSDLQIDTVKLTLYGQLNGRVNEKWYDNVVIARSYIGPISPGPTPTPTPTVTPTATPTPTTKCATPYYGPAPGPYNAADYPKTIVIHCHTRGVSIRFTRDGTTPTTKHGTLIAREGTAIVSAGQTLKAIAFADGYVNSNIASGNYARLSKAKKKANFGRVW